MNKVPSKSRSEYKKSKANLSKANENKTPNTKPLTNVRRRNSRRRPRRNNPDRTLNRVEHDVKELEYHRRDESEDEDGSRSFEAHHRREGRFRNRGPRITHRGNVVFIEHMERFKTQEPSMESVKQDFNYNITPSNPELFPWLAALAGSYESYLFEDLEFYWRTDTPVTVGGSVTAAVDYDPLDDDTELNSDVLNSMECSNSATVYRHMNLHCKESDLHKRKTYFIHPDFNVLAVDNSRSSVSGVLYTRLEAQSTLTPTTSAAGGRWYVRYRVKLMTPQPDFGLPPDKAMLEDYEHATGDGFETIYFNNSTAADGFETAHYFDTPTGPASSNDGRISFAPSRPTMAQDVAHIRMTLREMSVLVPHSQEKDVNFKRTSTSLLSAKALSSDNDSGDLNILESIRYPSLTGRVRLEAGPATPFTTDSALSHLLNTTGETTLVAPEPSLNLRLPGIYSVNTTVRYYVRRTSETIGTSPDFFPSTSSLEKAVAFLSGTTLSSAESTIKNVRPQGVAPQQVQLQTSNTTPTANTHIINYQQTQFEAHAPGSGTVERNSSVNSQVLVGVANATTVFEAPWMEFVPGIEDKIAWIDSIIEVVTTFTVQVSSACSLYLRAANVFDSLTTQPFPTPTFWSSPESSPVTHVAGRISGTLISIQATVQKITPTVRAAQQLAQSANAALRQIRPYAILRSASTDFTDFFLSPFFYNATDGDDAYNLKYVSYNLLPPSDSVSTERVSDLDEDDEIPVSEDKIPPQDSLGTSIKPPVSHKQVRKIVERRPPIFA